MPPSFVYRILHVVFSTRNRRFGWQSGYGAFTVSGSRLEEVRDYIARQQEHPHKVSFQEEFLSLLKKHGLEYDPNEVWG